MKETPHVEQMRKLIVEQQVNYTRLYAAATAVLREYQMKTATSTETFNQVIKRLKEELDL